MFSQLCLLLILLSLLLLFTPLVKTDLPYEGTAINIAVLNVVAPNVYRAQNRTLSKLGLRVNVHEFDFFNLYQEIVTDLKAGSPFYDAFLIPPVWIPDLVGCQRTSHCTGSYLEDLTSRIRDDTVLNWPDVNSFFRTYGALFSGKIYVVPLDGDVILNYIRTDALSRPFPNSQNISFVPVESSWIPRTIEDVLSYARQAHGRDLNGDGVADYGACIHRRVGQQATSLLFSLFTPVIQYSGTRSGSFFDIDTMEPLINNPETERIANMYLELSKYGPPNEMDLAITDVRDMYKAGRCAFTVDWGDVAIQANSSKFRDYILPIRSVGSHRVWDPNSGLKFCNDSSFCPYEDGGVNYAPYSANGGWSGAISSQIPELRKKAAFDFFAFLGSPDQSNIDVLAGNGFEMYRKNQMRKEFLVNANFPKSIANILPDEIDGSLNFPNVVIDLRIHNSEFFGAFDTFLGKFNTRNISAAEMLSMTEAKWTEMIDADDRKYLLDNYRATLDLPPKNYQVEKEISRGVRVALIVLSSICIFVTLGILFMIIRYASEQEIRAASPLFCLLVLIGGICIFISLVIYSVPVDKDVCMSIPWILNSGFVLLFASLLVKNYRIARIFSSHDLRAISAPIANKKLLMAVSFFMLLNFIILILWTSIDHLQVERTSDGVGDNEYILVCRSKNIGIWIGALVVLDGVLLLLGCFVSLQTRHIHQKMYNESTHIALATYNYALIALVVVPINILVNEPLTKFLIVGLGIMIATMVAILFLFVPKFYYLFFKRSLKMESGRQHTSRSMDPNNNSFTSRNQSTETGKCNKCGHVCKYC